MKIVITGSLGHISRPLAEELIKNGHQVTVISSKPNKQEAIKALGAEAAIGSIEDVNFLTNVFKGADAVYTMLPPYPFRTNPDFEYKPYTAKIVTNYVQAINSAGVKRVVHLSSVGAHLAEGSGLLIFHHIAEETLKGLSKNVSLTLMRPVGFYYNLYDFIDSIKGKGFLESFIGKMVTMINYGLWGYLKGQRGLILSNYGGNDRMPWVSPKDIAEAIAGELTKATGVLNIRYVASEELTCNEVARTLGEAVGKPYLKWGTITDKQMLDALIKYKLPRALAGDITTMNAAMHSGVLFEDYYKHVPALGKVKLKDFAAEFAKKYHQS